MFSYLRGRVQPIVLSFTISSCVEIFLIWCLGGWYNRMMHNWSESQVCFLQQLRPWSPEMRRAGANRSGEGECGRMEHTGTPDSFCCGNHHWISLNSLKIKNVSYAYQKTRKENPPSVCKNFILNNPVHTQNRVSNLQSLMARW